MARVYPAKKVRSEIDAVALQRLFGKFHEWHLSESVLISIRDAQRDLSCILCEKSKEEFEKFNSVYKELETAKKDAEYICRLLENEILNIAKDYAHKSDEEWKKQFAKSKDEDNCTD